MCKIFCTIREKIFFVFFFILGSFMISFQNVKCLEDTANSINTIEKFHDINEQLPNVDKDTLIILDVDYTLLQPSNPAFQQGNFRLSPEFIKGVMKSIPEKSKSEFATAVATSGEGQLLEEETPSIVESFKQKGVRVVVISGILTGQNLQIPNIMDWRINTLKRVGILPTTFEFDSIYQFKEFPPYRGEYPEIKEGVILTNGDLVKKHQVLHAFLKKIKWQPTKIIFVDDSRPLIEEMANYAKQQKIPFIGYEYKGAKKVKPSPISKEDLEQEWNRLKEQTFE